MSRVMVAMAYSRANNLSKLNHSVKLFMMIAQLCLGVYTVYRKWKLRMLFNFSSASTWLFSCLIYFNCLNSASLLRHQNVYCHVAYLSCSKKEKKWDYYQGLLREKNPLIFPKFWLRHKQKKIHGRSPMKISEQALKVSWGPQPSACVPFPQSPHRLPFSYGKTGSWRCLLTMKKLMMIVFTCSPGPLQ